VRGFGETRTRVPLTSMRTNRRLHSEMRPCKQQQNICNVTVLINIIFYEWLHWFARMHVENSRLVHINVMSVKLLFCAREC